MLFLHSSFVPLRSSSGGLCMNDFVGKIIGHYRLESQLRPGINGQMFKGLDLESERATAVKLIPVRPNQGAEFSLRFKTMLELVKNNPHPKVVQVFEVGQWNYHDYAVMEFISGGSVATLLQRYQRDGKSLELTLALNLSIQIAEGLSHGHKLGLVHGDVKPDNLMLGNPSGVGLLSRQYNLKVTDFGISKLHSELAVTYDDLTFGPPAYMSPEQCQGILTDARADLYSFGIVLYEMVTGLLPFEMKDIGEAAVKHMYSTPRSPREAKPDIPSDLETLILRLLAKSPTDRYASADDVASALQAILDRIEPPGPAPTLVVSPDARDRRPPTIAQLDDGVVAETPRVTIADDAGRIVKTVALTERGLRFGRQPDNDVQLEADTVSRYHLRVDWDGKRIAATDVGSSNGTTLEGQRLVLQSPTPWAYRSVLRVGSYWLRLEAPTPVSARNLIGLALETERLTLNPGAAGVLKLTLANLGRIVDHYSFEVQGIPSAWVKVPETAVQLNPGSQSPVALSIIVPRSSEARAGEHPITLLVRSRENPEATATAASVLTITPFAQTQLILRPSRRSARRRAVYIAQLANNGNTVLHYAPLAEEDDPALGFQFEPRLVTLQPGESRDVELRVTTPIKLIGGDSQRGFKVSAPASFEPITFEGDAPRAANFDPQAAAGNAANQLEQRAEGSINQVGNDAARQIQNAALGGGRIDPGALVQAATTRAGVDLAQAGHQAAGRAIQGGSQAINRALAGKAGMLGPKAVFKPSELPGASVGPIPAQIIHQALIPVWLPVAAVALVAAIMWFLMRPPMIQTFNASTEAPLLNKPVALDFDVSDASALELRVSDVEQPIKLAPGAKQFRLTGFKTTQPAKLTLIATGRFGAKAERSIDLRPREPETPQPQILEFSIFPKSLIKGQAVLIRYKVANAQEVTLEPRPGKLKTMSGSIRDFPTQPTTYTLKVKNKEKIDSKSIELKVDFLPPEAVRLWFSPARAVKGKDLTVRMFWKTRNASNIEIAPAPGPVSESGQVLDFPTPDKTTQFTLIAKNSKGVTKTFNATLVVVEPAPQPEKQSEQQGQTGQNGQQGQTGQQGQNGGTEPPVQAPSGELTASKTSVKAGESVTLSWTTKDARKVELQPLGVVAAKGSKFVKPTASVTYQLVATGANGQAITLQTLDVNVEANSESGTTAPQTKVPTGKLTASKLKIKAGESITLSWTTKDARKIEVQPIGEVRARGLQAVKPPSSVTYQLVATGADGKAVVVDTVQVNVAAASAGVLSSSYHHNFGELKLKQVGDKVTGTYTDRLRGNSGKLEGTFDGRVLTGAYTLNGNALPFNLTFSGDYRTFNGVTGESLRWCGSRDGTPFEPSCGFAGKWITSLAGVGGECAINLVRINNAVEGNYCDGTMKGKVEYKSGAAYLTGSWSSKGGKSGDFSFVLANANEAFTFGGRSNVENEWCGWRVGSSRPQQCLVK